MSVRGYLEGRKMATAFNMLRSNDLIWPYVIGNYFKGKEPPPFDLLYWNSDATRMPAANHSFYLRNCYLDNRLAKGEMEIGGVTLDLSKVKVPIYNLATREDHIAPPRSVFYGSSFFGGKVTFVLDRLRPHRRRHQPAGAQQVSVLDRRRAEGRRFDDWLDEGQGAPRLVVAALAGLDRGARRHARQGAPHRRRQDQGDRRRTGALRQGQGVSRC